LQIDGEALDAFMSLKNFFLPKSTNEDESDDQTKIKRLLGLYSRVFTEDPLPVVNTFDENNIYLDKVDIFPLDVTISIGANNFYWPVISEAHVSLASFQRSSLYNTVYNLIQFLTSAYFKFAWSELYQLIGSMDIIASPVQNFKKILRGFKDFFVLPVESLILDDTPGAFLIGVSRGTSSLILSLTDFLVTTLMKVLNVVSWVAQQATLDEEYRLVKSRVARQHPANLLQGIVQGSQELARGLLSAAISVCVQSHKGVKEEGVRGLLKGLGIGFMGVIFKPVGGILDFPAKILEGFLNSLGRGNLILTRLHTLTRWSSITVGNEAVERWAVQNGLKVFVNDQVKFINRSGRVTDRNLILCFDAFYIVNVTKLNLPGYFPKTIPIETIDSVFVPKSPETIFVLKTKQAINGQSQFPVIAPNRAIFVDKLALFFNIPVKEMTKP